MFIQDTKLEISLLLLRLSVFLVMFMWTIDKFLNPGHAASVYEKFYFIADLHNYIMYAIGTIEMIILILFLAGIFKTFSYGIIFLCHAVSTLSAYARYLLPFEPYNLLFFAAWPMLAACFVLFLLRERDVKFTIGES